MTKYFVVVCEAALDFEVTRTLTERIGAERPERDEPSWPLATGERFIKWSGLARLMGDLRVRPMHGHFEGKPGKPDASAGRNALQVARALAKRGIPIDGVVLQRDADTQPNRREGLEQAKRAVPVHFDVVIGVADPMIEAWLLAGFEPGTAHETRRVETETHKLGFDPRSAASKLTSKDEMALRNPKRVLRELAQGDPERVEECYRHAPLTMLRDRGVRTGLKAFLDEIEKALETVENAES